MNFTVAVPAKLMNSNLPLYDSIGNLNLIPYVSTSTVNNKFLLSFNI